MKISKKLENLYVRDCLTNERELNYQLGFRGIEVKFTNKTDWLSESEGEEYLICFEKFLNTCEDLDFYIYDGSSSVICNIAEMTVVVNDEDLETFNNLYKYYKKNYEEIIDGFRRELKEVFIDSLDMAMTVETDFDENTEIKVTPIVEIDNLKDYEDEKRKLYLEFENIIKSNVDYQNEIIAVEKSCNMDRKQIMDTLFLSHIDSLSHEWYEQHIYYKELFDWSDLIIKWSRMAEEKYLFSKKIVWKG